MSIITTITQLPNDKLFMILCKNKEEAKAKSTQYSCSWFYPLRNRDAGYLYVLSSEYKEKSK